MANIIVLPRLEIDNPFAPVVQTLEQEVIPTITGLIKNKEKIALLSDKELTDYIPILKQYAPDLLTQDDKIDWSKVEEYAKSDDLSKQQIANFLTEVRKAREDYANLPIGLKVNVLNKYAQETDPINLKKFFVGQQVVKTINDRIDKANLPEDVKLQLRLYIPLLAEKALQDPAYLSYIIGLFEGISGKKQQTTQEGGGTGGWRFSLDGQKQFGIKLEEPQLTMPQISPPQVPVAKQSGKVVGQEGIKAGQKSGGGQSVGTRQGDVKTEQKPAGEQGAGTGQVSVNNRTDDIIFPLEDPNAPGVKSSLSAEQLTNIGAQTLGLVNDFLLGTALFALLRDPQAYLKASALRKGAQAGAEKLLGKVFEIVGRKKANETTRKIVDEVRKSYTPKKAQIVFKKERIPITKEQAEKIKNWQKNLTLSDLMAMDILKTQKISHLAPRGGTSKGLEDVNRFINKQIAELEKKHTSPIEKIEFLKKLQEGKLRAKQKAKEGFDIKQIIQQRGPFEIVKKDITKSISDTPSKSSLTVSDDVIKEIERRKQLLNKAEQLLNQAEQVIETREQILKKAVANDPQKAELLKKLEDFKQKLDKIRNQWKKEQEKTIKILSKILAQRKIPITKPEQIDRALRAYKKMPPTEQLLRELIHISFLRPLEPKIERLRKLDEEVFKLMRPPQPTNPKTSKPHAVKQEKKKERKKKKY